jgi:hypothetical protein
MIAAEQSGRPGAFLILFLRPGRRVRTFDTRRGPPVPAWPRKQEQAAGAE